MVPTKTPVTDLVELVTGSETTKTPAPGLLPTMTPATYLVEAVPGSETTKTPAPDSLPTMTSATDLVPTKPAFNLVTTKTVSDLVEPVDSIPTKMSITNYFYKASRKSSYVKSTIFNMVLGIPPWSDSKVLKPPVSE